MGQRGRRSLLLIISQRRRVGVHQEMVETDP